jgi:hypothetical protein
MALEPFTVLSDTIYFNKYIAGKSAMLFLGRNFILIGFLFSIISFYLYSLRNTNNKSVE